MVNIDRAADLMEVGANGGAWVAPLGTASPGDPAVQPSTLWLPIGAISDDGLVQGFDEDSQEYTPWGYTSPVRTNITKSLRTFKITAWETTRTTVRSLQYRIPAADLTPDVGGLTTFSETASPQPDRRAWWFIVLDGDTQLGFYCPEAEISDRSDVTHKQDEMAGFEWTITAYPDTAGNTVYHADRVAATPAYTGS